MIRSLAPIAFLALIAADEPAQFQPANEQFNTAEACRSHLTKLAAAARTGDYVAVEGPYALSAGDVRIHMVSLEGKGHRIAEHRCLISVHAARSWTHSMARDEEEFTIESAARRAEWLKKGPTQ